MLALIKGAILNPEKGLHLITETAPVFFLFDLQCGCGYQIEFASAPSQRYLFIHFFFF